MTQFAVQPLPAPLSGLETAEQERNRAILLGNQRPGFFEAARLAVGSQWSTSWAVTQFRNGGYTYDPTFVLDEKLIRELGKDLPPQYWEAFTDAHSLQHAHAIRDSMLGIYQNRQRLRSLGWAGVALEMGAAMLDPGALALDIAITAATGGFAGPAVMANRLNRVQRFVRGGLIGAASQVPIQTYLSSQDPEQGVNDTLWAAAGSFMLGGGINAIRRTKAATELRRAADAAMLLEAQPSVTQDAMGAASRTGIRADRIAEIDATLLKPQGRVYFDKAWGKAAQSEAVDEAIRIAGLDPVDDAAEIATIRGLAPDMALARLQTAAPHLHVQEVGAIPLTAQRLGDWDTTNVTDARAAMTWVRPSLAARLGATESPAIRTAGNLLVQDALLKADGSAQNLAGSEWVRQRYGAALFRLDQETAPYWNEYVKRVKPHFWERARVYNEFNENIGRIMRADPSLLPDSLEKSASMPYRQLFGDVLEIAQRHGVPGLETVVRDPSYMPTLWNYKRLNKLIASDGFDKVASRLIAPAIRAKSQDVEQALRSALAKNLTATAQDIDNAVDAAFNHVARGYLNVVHHLDKFTDYARHKVHLSLDEGTLTDVLKAGGLTDQQTIDDIVSAFIKKRPAAGTPERGMKRMPMDYDFYSPEFGVTVADLLENNIEAVSRSYVRAMFGAAAEHRMLQTMQARFKTAGPIDSWEKLKSFLTVDAAQNGMSEGQISAAIDRLDIAHRALIGKPINPRTGLSETLRAIRAYNHIRLSGQFGIAQANEIGNVVGEGGWVAATQQMPVLRRIMHAASNGTMPDTLLNDIAAANGLGTDNIVHMVTSRFDRDLQEVAANSKVGQTLDRVAYTANYVSLMTPLTVAQKRSTAAVMAQRWFNQAWSGRRPSKARLALAGMTESEWDALAPLLKKHGKYEENILGRRLVSLDFDGLHADNPTAAARLITALDRTATRIIQENDLGNLPGIATSDWFKVMFQFKTFALAAWEKHLLSRVQMRDFPAFMGFAWNLVVAGLTYTAAVHVTTLGKPDREKRLKESLDPARIGAAAFQRTSASSLIPNFIDTARQLTHYDPIFKERYTGTSVGFLDFNSNPTVSVVNSAARAIGTTAVAPFRDDVTISQATANQWSQLLPFRRVLGISNMIDYTTSQFPKQR